MLMCSFDTSSNRSNTRAELRKGSLIYFLMHGVHNEEADMTVRAIPSLLVKMQQAAMKCRIEIRLDHTGTSTWRCTWQCKYSGAIVKLEEHKLHEQMACVEVSAREGGGGGGAGGPHCPKTSGGQRGVV